MDNNIYDLAASPTSPPAAPSSGHHQMEAINNNLTTPVMVRNSRDRGFTGGSSNDAGGSGNGSLGMGGYIDVDHTPGSGQGQGHTPVVIDSATLDAAISAFSAVAIGSHSHGLTSPSGKIFSSLPNSNNNNNNNQF